MLSISRQIYLKGVYYFVRRLLLSLIFSRHNTQDENHHVWQKTTPVCCGLLWLNWTLIFDVWLNEEVGRRCWSVLIAQVAMIFGNTVRFVVNSDTMNTHTNKFPVMYLHFAAWYIKIIFGKVSFNLLLMWSSAFLCLNRHFPGANIRRFLDNWRVTQLMKGIWSGSLSKQLHSLRVFSSASTNKSFVGHKSK